MWIHLFIYKTLPLFSRPKRPLSKSSSPLLWRWPDIYLSSTLTLTSFGEPPLFFVDLFVVDRDPDRLQRPSSTSFRSTLYLTRIWNNNCERTFFLLLVKTQPLCPYRESGNRLLWHIKQSSSKKSPFVHRTQN